MPGRKKICKQSARRFAVMRSVGKNSVPLHAPADLRPPLAGQTWWGAQFAATLDLVKMTVNCKKTSFVI
jgi:hypothetical protein